MRLFGATALFGAAALAVSVAQAQDPEPTANAAVQAPPGQERSGGWTRNLMRDANPLRPLVLDTKPRMKPVPRKTEGAAAGSADLQNRGETARQSGDPKSVPLKWAGKLFFKKPDGRYVCSGQFISERVVLTAAHCVQDSETGKYYSDFLFALQYNQDKYSKLYGWRCVGTKRGWVTDGENRYAWDYAMLLADAASTTGNFGWHYGWENEYPWAAKIGYPTEIRAGKVIQVENGPISRPPDVENLVAMQHDNPKSGGGSSGGAFVGNYEPKIGRGNKVISVTSFALKNEPNIDYGPYLDSNFKDLLDYVTRGCR